MVIGIRKECRSIEEESPERSFFPLLFAATKAIKVNLGKWAVCDHSELCSVCRVI